MIYILISAVIFAADLITKYLAAENLMGTDGLNIIKGVFDLTYVENRGVAFGAFTGGRNVFIVLTAVMIVLILLYLKKTPKDNRSVWQKIGTSLLTGGAAGNLADRIFRGYVVDFLNFKLIDFPVFNIADIAVCTGVALLIVHMLVFDVSEKNKVAAEENIINKDNV